MGSDGYHPLDGRVGLMTAHNEAHRQADRLRRVKPHYIGYAVHSGDIRNNHPITNPLPLPGKESEFKVAKAIGFVAW